MTENLYNQRIEGISMETRFLEGNSLEVDLFLEKSMV